MADPRAFISFDFDHDETSRMLFVGQAKNSKTPFAIQDWSSKSALPEAEWEASIDVKIGKTMASATGVAKELAMAKKREVPVFDVYVDGAGSTSNLPAGLPRNRTITWTWDGAAAAITQMMGEGKNKA